MELNRSLRPINCSSTTVERYVIGTHRTHQLSHEALSKLALMASRGFVLHPYNDANRGTEFERHTLHAKKTQGKARARTADERRRFDEAATEAAQPVSLAAFEHSLLPRVAHAYGLSQRAEVMFDDPVAQRLFVAMPPSNGE